MHNFHAVGPSHIRDALQRVASFFFGGILGSFLLYLPCDVVVRVEAILLGDQSIQRELRRQLPISQLFPKKL